MGRDDSITRPVYLTPQALSQWIPALRRERKMYKFYQTPEWKALRAQVLQANHGECEDCRCKSPSVITPAVTVHHDKEVDRFPELALSTFWIDAKGRKHQQLFTLCNNCHNKRHDRYFDGHKREDEEPLTPERW